MQRSIAAPSTVREPSSAAHLIKPRVEWLQLAAILVFAVVLRWLSPAMKSDLWYDEVCSYATAARPFASMMRTLYLGADTNPPLYTVLLHFWMKLGSSDTHVKLLSLLFATAAIIVLYVLVRRIAGKYVALLSCLLIASSSSVITYSVEARPYAIFLFLSLSSTYFLLSAVRDVKPRLAAGFRPSRLWVLYSVATILTVYTHWFGLLLIAVQAVGVAISHLGSGREIRPYFISLTAVACCCLPLALFLRNQITLQQGVGGYVWPEKPRLRSLASLAAFLTGGENLLAVTMLIPIVIFLNVYLNRRRPTIRITADLRRHITFFASYLVLPVLAVFLVSTLTANSFFVHRYFLPFIIGVHILIGLALSRLDRRIAFAFVLIFVLFPLGKIVKHRRSTETPYSQTASALSIQSREDTLIAHLSPMSYYPVLHYSRGDAATAKILCPDARGGYETAYNLDGHILTEAELIVVGERLHSFRDLWVVVDPMDKDVRQGEAYEYIRNDRDFVLESTRQIRGLRLEHYTLRAADRAGAF